MHLLRILLLIATLACTALASHAQVQGESRLALLIGNGNYKSSPLKNPVNDVRLMESSLTEAGFTVLKAENATRREMQRLVRDFGERLKQAGGVGLFYFAGHGVQVKGANYLVPVDADIRAEDEVAFDSVDAQSILEKMETAKNRINLLILDACRDNPFAKGSRSSTAGLATMSAPSGSLVAYSTAPGSVASDGAGNNGLYTQHLAAVMRMSDIPIEEVFKRVRANVRKDSANQQTPWENTALEGNFYFKKSPPVVMAALTPTPAPQPIQVMQAAPNTMAVELSYWDSIKSSNRPFELEAYIEQFPNGSFVGLAKARLREVTRELAAAKEREDRAAARAQEDRQTSAKDSAKELELAKAREKAASLELALAAARATPFIAMATPPSNAAANAIVKAAVNMTNLAQGQSIGTLQMVDRIFNKKSELQVTVAEKTEAYTLMSTGDKIASDGRVLAVLFAEQIVTLKNGALWKLPLRVGLQGQADIQFGALGIGTIEWQVKAGAEHNQEIVVATFNYRNPAITTLNARWGTWSADYRAGQLMPSATSFNHRSPQQLFTTTLTP